MKAPDKIYVREYPDGIARFWESKKKEDVVATIPHEYIRKDALLEWINNAKNSLIIDNTKALQLGKIGSFAILDALIEKLNSM